MSRGAFEPRIQPRWGQIRGDLEDQLDLAPLVLENGFDDRSESIISFVDGTRTFSIAPVGDSFFVNSGGYRFEKTATENLVIPDLEGIHFIYYDETGTLQSTQVFEDDIILHWAFTSIIYWDADNSEHVLFGDERHGNSMDSMTHLYNHNTRGTAYGSGLQVGDVVATGNGDDAEDAQCSLGAGVIWDEDIALSIPAQAFPAEIPIVYKSGPNGYWRKLDATQYICTTAGSGRAAYNEWTGATWQLTEVGNLDHVLMHLYASDDVDTGYFLVVGQNTYNTTGQARDGALVEIFDLDLSGLPVIEQLPVATFILQTGDGYTNAVKSRVRETDSGEAFIDWRGQETGAIFAISGAITPTWGGIAGTLSNQLDLQAEFDATNGQVTANSNAITALVLDYLDHINGTDDFHDAVDIVFDPLLGSGTLAATDVQNAITELESDIVATNANIISALADKVDIAGDTMTGVLNIITSLTGPLNLERTDQTDNRTILSFALEGVIGGQVRQDNDSNLLEIRTPNANEGLKLASGGSVSTLFLDGSQRAIFGDLTSDALGAEASSVTISNSDSGVTSIPSGCDDLIIEGDNTHTRGMCIATPDTGIGQIAFVNDVDGNAGGILYYHSAEAMQIRNLLGTGEIWLGTIPSVIIDEDKLSMYDGSLVSLDITNEGNTSNGPDIQFYGAGLIAAESSFYIAIDSNNDTEVVQFEIIKDANNTTSGISLFRFEEDGLATVPNGGAFEVMAAHLTKSSDQTLTGTYADIPWNTELRLEPNTYSHSANSAEIAVLEDGAYKITLTVTTIVTSGTDRSGALFKLQEDSSGSFVDIPGTQISTYARDATTAYNTATAIAIVVLSAGDIIKAQGYQYDGTSTVDIDADGTTITIERIR